MSAFTESTKNRQDEITRQTTLANRLMTDMQINHTGPSTNDVWQWMVYMQSVATQQSQLNFELRCQIELLENRLSNMTNHLTV